MKEKPSNTVITVNWVSIKKPKGARIADAKIGNIKAPILPFFIFPFRIPRPKPINKEKNNAKNAS